MSVALAMALAKAWGITDEFARDWLAIKPAIKASVDSQLPGRENGPADAYRHLLWGAELTRKFGPDVARRILEMHEIQNDLSTGVGLGSQTPAAAAMDRHNNPLAVEIGMTARTWNDVEQRARGDRGQSRRWLRWWRGLAAGSAMVEPPQGPQDW
jgi:hypothetical protein